MFIDMARKTYHEPYTPHLKGYATCVYDGSKLYYMGVDWNGQGTGTRIRVVEYDPNTRMTRCVAKQSVDKAGFTTKDSLDAIVALNKKWRCTKIYVDHGYGASQFDQLKLIGLNATDFDTQRLKDVKSIDFGANLITNGLTATRTKNGSRYIEQEEVKRRTKPFMVEGAVMRFEQQLVEFSDDDIILDEQLRGYRVKSYSADGYANTYTWEGSVGDHDLDAFMLALLAVEMDHGLYSTPEIHRKMANVEHVSSWGMPTPRSATPASSQEMLEEKKDLSGLNRRVLTNNAPQDEFRILFLQRGGATIAPNPRANRSFNSRTEIFGSKTGRRF
jgi:hypothetical protein